jgi:hypothetical protein
MPDLVPAGGDDGVEAADRPYLMTEPIVAVLVAAALAGIGVLLRWARERKLHTSETKGPDPRIKRGGAARTAPPLSASNVLLKERLGEFGVEPLNDVGGLARMSPVR